MTVEILGQFQLATDAFAKLAAGVRPDQLALKTPCPEWSVRDLIDHVVKGNLMFTRVITGAEPPAVDVGADPDAAVLASSKALYEAASAEGVLTQIFKTPMGERPGGRLIAIRINELSLHGWDLAQATGQGFELPDPVIATCFQVLQAILPEDRTSTPYDAEQPAGPDASPTQRLIAFAGRSVTA
ncbi:TIGR03086 family metal-binding protein [Actinoplanes sp. NPDC049681]|uniref:TIGR03086 family metal-binding protein n=1 Tax=Actinoplanes sp. NPDC049681 TaxID=3363905 RepID=UPI0037BDA588